ncbi:MAG: site-specific integrase [Deltaproteobacteria bacterium]|nr:site-specific integrase [Deltaproteobacteria bacterium]
MAILQECPLCKRKQKLKNKTCSGCECDLKKGRKSNNVKYYISYYLPNGKQRREMVGFSLSDAKAADGKRKGQKKENRLFDIKEDSTMTFNEMAKWYTNLETVKRLATHNRIKIVLENFNKSFGDMPVCSIQPVDIENYQIKREEAERAPATIDMEISIVKTMVNKAFDNDKIDGHPVKVFRTIRRKLKKGSNVRKRILTLDEYTDLCDVSPKHLKAAIITGFNTGMRLGEIRHVQWAHIDEHKAFIRLPAAITKEKRDKTIPINHHVKAVLETLPRAIKHNNVFTYRGVPIIHKNGLKNAFRSACEKAEIVYGRDKENGLIFHDIRRSTKTHMMKAGVGKTYRDLLLGHTLTGMDIHYMAPSDQDLKKAMDIFTTYIDENLKNSDRNSDQKEKGLTRIDVSP